MFGGIGTIVLVVVMRVLVARAWREGIGLTLTRRLLVPATALVIGLFALRHSASTVLQPPPIVFVTLALVVTAAAAVVRATTVEYSTVAEAPEHPGGVRIRARTITLAADVTATLCAAALIFPTVAPAVGFTAAGGSLTVVIALGDGLASGLLVLRGAPSPTAPDPRRSGHSS